MEYTRTQKVKALKWELDGSNWREVCKFLGDEEPFEDEEGGIPEFLEFFGYRREHSSEWYCDLLKGEWVVQEPAFDGGGFVTTACGDGDFRKTFSKA